MGALSLSGELLSFVGNTFESCSNSSQKVNNELGTFFGKLCLMNIEFKYEVNQTTNLFHFISNLTDWHFSVRKRYAEKWLQQTGELTSEENKCLSEITELFKKYTFGKNYWGKVFLTKLDNEVWKEAENAFGEDAIKFKNLSDIFQKRFDLIWKKEESKLKEWQNLLKETEKDFVNQDLIEDLSVLFGVTPEIEEDIQVNLLLGGPGGGANTDRYCIEMEVSDLPEEKIERVWAVIWHELIHKFWETGEYRQMLHDFSKEVDSELVKGVPNHIVIKEMVVAGLLPWGYFRKKYFKTDTDEYIKRALQDLGSREEKSMSYFMFLAALKMEPVIKEHLENKKPIGMSFLGKIKSLVV